MRIAMNTGWFGRGINAFAQTRGPVIESVLIFVGY
jgi:hypothetical protein